MDRLQQASESGLSISLYVDGRYGSYSTNRLDKKELETFIKNGIESTRYLAVDEARVLPDASRYYKGGKPDLQLSDRRFETINPDDKVAIARAAAEEVLGKDSRIISVGTSYGDGESSSYRLTSNGFEGESKSTWFSLSADVALRGPMLPVIIKVESRTCNCLTGVSKLLIRTTKLPLRVLLPKKSWAKTAALYP